MNFEPGGQDGPKKSHIKLCINARTDYLCVVRTAVRQVGAVLGMAQEDIESVTLAVDEALSNVICHSYGEPCDKPVIVDLSEIENCKDGAGGFEILIRDFGKQVDPALIKGRDLDEIRPGGLGVHIIESVMDQIEYTRAEDSGMKLRMLKHIS
jgi:anti-sigma regulatory factor (Ser/Thr protein kinase)